MSKKLVFHFVFAFAALLFIAKPFLGYSAFNNKTKPRISHSILVKSFTKRKPDDLQDARAKAQAIRQLISDPPLRLVSAIAILMALLLPFAIESITKITHRVITDIRDSLSEPVPAWLLAGKLTI